MLAELLAANADRAIVAPYAATVGLFVALIGWVSLAAFLAGGATFVYQKATRAQSPIGVAWGVSGALVLTVCGAAAARLINWAVRT